VTETQWLIILAQERFILANDLLTLNNIHASYGSSRVLHGVSFSLKQGELLALLGRNGAGKTTTMLTLSGLLPANKGEILLRDKRTDNLTPEAIARQGIRLVPQGRRVFANLSVEENLIVASQRRKIAVTWNIARVYEMFPQLKSRTKQRAGTLSGGEQQMLVIGRALMGNPDVLLLDEPSEGLAPLIVNEVNESILKLKNEGLSIILVEQNFKVAKALADHIVVLNIGQVVFNGRATEVMQNPELATRHLGIF
jgi:branched-chain amino acid transport system ATP-binding protein